MTACFRCLLDLDRHARRAFLHSRVRTVPGKRPTPVHAHFVVRIDQILYAKLTTKHLGVFLCDRDGEGFTLFGPVSVTYPQRVLTATWNLQILVQRRTSFISTRGCRVPLTLT